MSRVPPADVSPVVDVGVGDHHVSVDGDGQDVEDGHPEQPVPDMKIWQWLWYFALVKKCVELEESESLHQPEEGVELAELRPPDPVAGEELGGGQREVEAAEEKVRHGEVDDEDGRGVAHLSHAPVICHLLTL